MKKENEHNEIDQLLLERLGAHTIAPGEELWNKIEHRLEPRTVSFHKHTQLKRALLTASAVIGGLIFLLVALKKHESAKHKTSEQTTFTKSLSEKKTAGQNKLFEIRNNNRAIVTMREKSPQILKNNYNQNRYHPLEEKKILQQSAQNVSRACRISMDEIKTLKAENLIFDGDPGITVLKKEVPAIPKPPAPTVKKHHHARRSKTRHISAKRYFAQNKSASNPGTFLNRFDLKVNVTPAYSTRLINNAQNVSVVEYDQAFYNNNERGKLTLNGGVELAYKINPKWSIYSGVKLFRYAEQIQNGQNQYTIVSSNRIIIPSSAGNIGITGDGIGLLSTLDQFESKLKLQFLDIPMIVRYYIGANMYVDGGFKYSRLLYDATSVSLNSDNLNFSIEKAAELSKHNFGLVLGTGIEHITHSGIRFEVGPEISLNINNINPSSEVISKPVSLGIHAGIFIGRYRPMYD